tara:strand:+ start:420 stop:1154 length:735 start_codon:yes stop_codon:yes gene_type:complete
MKKFFSLTAVLGILFFVLIEFLGDKLIKNILENNISSSLNRNVEIEKLNIDYLSGKASAKNITLLNKKFDGYLIGIDSINVNLDTYSIFSNNILINDVLLNNIKLNYYFNLSDQKINDNLKSLQKDLKYENTNSESNKYFNIRNLEAKNISLSVLSPELNVEKTFAISDIKLNDIGNTKNSKDYKDALKKIFNDTIDNVKNKVLNDNFLDKLYELDTDLVEEKIKEKLNLNKDKIKNKLKGLIN